MLIFSIKNAFRKKLTAILASLGVGFGLMLVFVIGAFTAGVSAQFQDNLSKTLGIVNVTEEFQTGANSHLPLDLPDALFNTPGVGDSIVSYNVETEAPLSLTSEYFKDPDPDKLILKGLNVTIDQAWGGATTKIIEGRLFEVGKNETIIDSRLVDISGFPNSLGSNITIDLGNSTMNLEIVGVYAQDDTGAPSFVPRDYYIYVDIQLVWDLLEEAGEVSNMYTLISLRFDVKNYDATEKYVERLKIHLLYSMHLQLFLALLLYLREEWQLL
jgi:hypothetical protein